MGCCESKKLSEEEVLTRPKRSKHERLDNRGHTIEISDYEYSYTYSDSEEES